MEHRTPTGYTAAHVEFFRDWVLHSIMKASNVNNSEVSDLHHCFNKGSINWVQCDTCTRWLHAKCEGLIRQAAVQCEKYTCFLANNGFFSIKLQGVNIHVCINQGITATSTNLMLNAQLSFWPEQCPTCMHLLQCCVCQLYLRILYWLSCLHLLLQ